MAHSNSIPNDGHDGIHPFTGPIGEDAYELEYEIVDDPIEETRVGLSPEVEAEYADLHERTMNAPATAIPRLEELVAKYPSIPVLKNWLSVAYTATCRRADADAMEERLWRDHPDYPFARVARALYHLQRDELDEVPEVLGKLDLKLMYPHRNVFHISEVVALYNVLAEWCYRKGQPETAMIYLDQLEELAPDHPVTARLELLLMPQILAEAMKQLGSRRRRSVRRQRVTAKSKNKTKRGA